MTLLFLVPTTVLNNNDESSCTRRSTIFFSSSLSVECRQLSLKGHVLFSDSQILSSQVGRLRDFGLPLLINYAREQSTA